VQKQQNTPHVVTLGLYLTALMEAKGRDGRGGGATHIWVKTRDEESMEGAEAVGTYPTWRSGASA
jgi:hypothetical protein